MRHFTMAWWYGVQKGLTAHPHDDYFAYVTALRTRVPPERLPALDALLGLALHDSTLRHLRLEPAAATLHILLDNRYTGARFTLAYTGVEQFTSEPDPVGGFSSQGYGDLGYDEVDLSPTGALVHRVLFASGIELEVVFKGFEFLPDNPAEPGAAAAGGA
ncbi:MAG: hypothetical protein HY290_24260 [Planctomycetia bacterium]|nr:hypothetical protein [Planctomycetia bacterium]